MKAAASIDPIRNLPVVSTFFCLTIASVLQADKLDTLFSRGDSSIAVTWIPDSINTREVWYRTNGSKCTGADSIYQQCDFVPGATYRSIAYSYGGEDSYTRFREKIAEGFLVGSHMCHYNTFGDPSPVVAGTDCSGFICYLWDVPRVSTRELYSNYTIITRDNLDVGDILVKPASHAVLIIDREDDVRFLIWESTSAVNGCRERSIDITEAAWDAYSPRRYEGLTSGVRRMQPGLPGVRFPGVTVNRDRVILQITSTWRGTIALYSLRGELLASTPCHVEDNAPANITTHGAAGIRIISLRSDQGDFAILPVSSVNGFN